MSTSIEIDYRLNNLMDRLFEVLTPEDMDDIRAYLINSTQRKLNSKSTSADIQTYVEELKGIDALFHMFTAKINELGIEGNTNEENV